MKNRRGYYAKCPNCGVLGATQRDYVRHLLEEAKAAGRPGVTTNQFLAWHAGSRFGARVHELRHEEGLTILEDNELYTLVDAGGATAHQEVSLGGPPSGEVGTRGGSPSSDEHWTYVRMCPRCAYAPADGPVCPRGHRTVKGWSGDFRRPAPARDIELARAA